MLYPNFKKFIEKYNLLEDCGNIVVGVSGGIDSIVLCHLLHRLSKKQKLSIIVAHINYGLRGNDSNMDEKFVRQLTDKYGFEFRILKKKPSVGKNLQAEARRIRMSFFESVAKSFKTDKVWLAHNANDQAETILLHFIRGAGLSGLCGMQPVSKGDGFALYRPLLFAPRSDIEVYARKNKLKFRKDKTNDKTKYTRNLIRHKVIPTIMDINPNFMEQIFNLSKRLDVDRCALDDVATGEFEKLLLVKKNDRVELNASEYLLRSKAIRIRVLRYAFLAVSGQMQDLNSDQIEKIDDMVINKKGKGSYKLPKSCVFELSSKKMCFLKG